jgi:hypothetical protein
MALAASATTVLASCAALLTDKTVMSTAVTAGAFHISSLPGANSLALQGFFAACGESANW